MGAKSNPYLHASHSVVFGFELMSAAILGLTALVLIHYTHRGRGFKARPHKEGGPKEELLLGSIATGFTCYVRICRAVNAMANGKAPNIWTDVHYLDFMFSCPMLVLDLICTVDAKGKIMYPFMTFVVLFMGFMSYAEEGPARFAWFGIGMVVFAVFFFIMEKVFRKKLDEKKEMPVEHLELQRAMWCFFGFWPVFPFMWALGAQGAQVISPELDIVIHCFLDIGAKGAFTFFLMRYRLYEEDREGDEEDRAAKLASGGYSADTALAAQQYPQQGAPYGQEFDRMTIRSTQQRAYGVEMTGPQQGYDEEYAAGGSGGDGGGAYDDGAGEPASGGDDYADDAQIAMDSGRPSSQPASPTALRARGTVARGQLPPAQTVEDLQAQIRMLQDQLASQAQPPLLQQQAPLSPLQSPMQGPQQQPLYSAVADRRVTTNRSPAPLQRAGTATSLRQQEDARSFKGDALERSRSLVQGYPQQQPQQPQQQQQRRADEDARSIKGDGADRRPSLVSPRAGPAASPRMTAQQFAAPRASPRSSPQPAQPFPRQQQQRYTVNADDR